MKKILGLDLGTNSIGWALVSEAETKQEKSSIIRMGVRVNPLTVDEKNNFEEGKSITTNADRTLKRSARKNLYRYKIRRENLIEALKENGFITDNTILSEQGNNSTFNTYRLRAKAAKQEINLEDFAKVLLIINKKRGYKSYRKAKGKEEGELIDGMDVAKELYKNDLTPGQYILSLLKQNKKYMPEFYRSDLQNELDKIWSFQKQFYPNILTDEFKEQIQNKGKEDVSKIFLAEYKIYTLDIKGNRDEKKLQTFQLRADALRRELIEEELALVIKEVNGSISNSSGYLGKISDRSKELYFRKETIGEYLMNKLDENPHYSLKNQVFYRQDYLDEFNIIWEEQKKYHKEEFTEELKKEIRDIVIFYQRRLKSQKGLISFCEFESREIKITIDGKEKTKKIGSRVCPKSSPLFQGFKIWQILNNIELRDENNNRRFLEQEEKDLLFEELTIREKLTKQEVLKVLFKDNKELDLNFKEIEGNRTIAQIIKACPSIENDSSYKFYSDLDLEDQLIFKLWHLLYSYEGDNTLTGDGNLILRLENQFGFTNEEAKACSKIKFQDAYSSLSTKAIKKILPFMKEGNKYDVACVYAGYRHSKESLAKEEIENKKLKDKLEILSKNSLRNPVVEKILNQMVNVVNGVIDAYGKPDEIRIELARELKKNAEERKSMTKSIGDQTKLHEEYIEKIKNDFGFSHVSRNDIIRYKLYLELKENSFHTLYSNKYIPYEKIFSKEYDIEHIIPQSRVFDDSFSNKTLEIREANIEKGNRTAYDYILDKYGEEGVKEYIIRLDNLVKKGAIKYAKYKKLKMKLAEIPNDFINRDLRDSQYIAKKAKQMLLSISRVVTSTSGSITDRLREDWQLINVMQELNWNKYNKLGLTEIIENKDGERIYRIKDWTKRNDHRHHAMDALTIAFTKPNHIQYLNNLNARSDKSSIIYAIEQNELTRNEKGKLLFNPPMPLNEFREEAKQELENILISIKAKNKVVTKNINITKKKGETNKKIQLTPRGQLHKETIYGSITQYATKEERINASFTKEKILIVAKKDYRDALLKRLKEFGDDAKKAFTGKNSLDKNPIFYGKQLKCQVPEKVKIVSFETLYTIRKAIDKYLKIDKVVDAKIRKILQERLNKYDNNPTKAFSNIDKEPIWLNEKKGISIKRVTITGINNAISLHSKKDKEGNYILDEKDNKQPIDFVSTGNNHHVAIYKDDKGNLQENVIPFFDATIRANNCEPIVDRTYKQNEGWQFLFSMKQNEYFVFPNEENGFNPKDMDESFFLNPTNSNLISPNLYRVQTISKIMYEGNAVRDYKFRHHLETTVKDKKELKGIAYKQCKSLDFVNNIVKVRVNHIGQIVSVGEY